MDVSVIEYPGCRYAAIRHIGSFTTIGTAFDRLSPWAHEHRDLLQGPPMAIYLDHPDRTPEHLLRSDAAIPVTEDAEFSGAPELRHGQLDRGRCAILTHRGSYAGLPAAWAELDALVSDQGLHVDGSRPAFEIYESNPLEVEVEDLITVLYRPVH